MAINNKPRHFTPKQLAEQMGIPLRTVQDHLKKGHVLSVNGLIPDSEVMDLLYGGYRNVVRGRMRAAKSKK